MFLWIFYHTKRLQPFAGCGVDERRIPKPREHGQSWCVMGTAAVADRASDPKATMSEQGDLSMTFTGRFNLIVAYAALAFVGAIVLGLF